jgi:hypothetical protein
MLPTELWSHVLSFLDISDIYASLRLWRPMRLPSSFGTFPCTTAVDVIAPRQISITCLPFWREFFSSNVKIPKIEYGLVTTLEFKTSKNVDCDALFALCHSTIRTMKIETPRIPLTTLPFPHLTHLTVHVMMLENVCGLLMPNLFSLCICNIFIDDEKFSLLQLHKKLKFKELSLQFSGSSFVCIGYIRKRLEQVMSSESFEYRKNSDKKLVSVSFGMDISFFSQDIMCGGVFDDVEYFESSTLTVIPQNVRSLKISKYITRHEMYDMILRDMLSAVTQPFVKLTIPYTLARMEISGHVNLSGLHNVLTLVTSGVDVYPPNIEHLRILAHGEYGINRFTVDIAIPYLPKLKIIEDAAKSNTTSYRVTLSNYLTAKNFFPKNIKGYRTKNNTTTYFWYAF